MNVAARQRMSLDEFLTWDETQERRWEFDGFEPVAMVGGTAPHSRITVNLLTALNTRLRGSQCDAYDGDMQIDAAGSIRYPDATVSCKPIPPGTHLVIDPVTVFEVLSPSTASIDNIVKAAEYRGTPITNPAAILEMPEIGISIPLAECYIGVIDL